MCVVFLCMCTKLSQSFCSFVIGDLLMQTSLTKFFAAWLVGANVCVCVNWRTERPLKGNEERSLEGNEE